MTIKSIFSVSYLTIFLASCLFCLWTARGNDVAGWELLGPSEGVVQIKTLGWKQALINFWKQTRDFQCWNPTNSLVFGFVPALLHQSFPWLLWSQVLNLVLCLVFAWVGVCAVGGEKKIYLAAWAASPALLSHIIVGYPYISGLIPYACALAYVFWIRSKPLSKYNFFIELFFWPLLFELSLSCYELGKTVFLVPLFAALTFSKLSLSRRFIWLSTGITFGYFIRSLGKSNVDYFTRSFEDNFFQLTMGIQRLFDLYFVRWYLDVPVLALVATIACFKLKKDKWFWCLLFLAQISLLVVAATIDESLIRPRRTLLFLFISTLIVSLVWKELRENNGLRYLFIALLGSAQVYTAVLTYRFVHSPQDNLSLPYTQSQADFRVDRSLNRDAERIVLAAQKETLKQYVAYGYSEYPENTTDPQGLPERVYLRLGHELSQEKVRFVDELARRYSSVPSTNKDNFLQMASKEEKPFIIRLYNARDYVAFTQQILNRSDYRLVSVDGFENFKTILVEKFAYPGPIEIHPLDDKATLRKISTYQHRQGQSSLCQVKANASSVAGFVENIPYSGERPQKLIFPINQEFSNSESWYLSAITFNQAPEEVTFNLTVDDEVLIRINGQVVLSALGNRVSTVFSTTALLPSGLSKLEVLYSNLHGYGVLKLDSQVQEGRSNPVWECEVLESMS